MSSTPRSMATTSTAAMSSTKTKAGILNQPRSVWAVFFACVIAFMGLGLVDPILPAIANNLHATHSEVTLLFTSYNAVMAVAMLITGAISTRIGIKRTLIIGIIVIALFSGLGGFSNSIWTLVGLRGGWGLGNALFVATALAAIVSLSTSGTAQAIILYEAAIGLGISVGPLLGGWLGAISWRGPFLGVAALMVVAFFGLITLMPKTNSKSKSFVKSKASLLDPFRALKHRSLLIFGIGAALYNFGFFTLLAYAPFVMGLDIHGIGYVFLGWGILLAFTSVFMAPKLQQWFGTVKSMCSMLILFALLLLAMGIWTSTQWVVIACVILAGALLGNNNTLITTAVMNAAPVERSTASAAYSFLRFLGGTIAPFLSGKLAEWYLPSTPFIVGAGFVLLSVVFIGFNYRYLKHVDEVEVGH
ncbi:MFS transporter [Bacillus sp. EB600]|nr:MFS transporter [Bacillus sp. EB600]MCQ6279235.1 MFS transporter [Bacillus sp. EB600]